MDSQISASSAESEGGHVDKSHDRSKNGPYDWQLTHKASASLQDMEHMASRSQAAEMGQLKPRSRPPSAEPPSSTNASWSNLPVPFLNETNRSGCSQVDDPFRTPTKARDHIAPSFQSFLDSDPNTTGHRREPLMHGIEVPTPVELVHSMPAMPQDFNPPGMPARNHVLRKVNSGFEILPPGSLSKPVASDGSMDSAAITGRGRKAGRKLHRKQMPSAADIRLSAFQEMV